ncbi:60S ribosomal protein L27a-2 [Capsicum annuum]|nr:60S ribosomal protein L27a-2 [Capsicum annuum]
MTAHFKKNKEKCGYVSAVKDKAAASKGSAPLINMTQYGYFKVLGKGVLPENRVVVVKAKLISKNDEKKIKENGGAVVLTA